MLFLSTPSARRATCRSSVSGPSSRFLSTPSARRATSRRCRCCRSRPISIHALREEGDPSARRKASSAQNFYPRPPRGGRLCRSSVSGPSSRFLSTPSARRATEVCGADRRICEISIHALREEGDPTRPRSDSQAGHFYPRPPRGGRHRRSQLALGVAAFLSTPSARRATLRILCAGVLQPNFYPRPPRGGRPRTPAAESNLSEFLSTPSARRATPDVRRFEPCKRFLSTPSARRATCIGRVVRPPSRISIHALREEGDPSTSLLALTQREFLSTPSARRATHAAGRTYGQQVISIHALREEGDTARPASRSCAKNFYPRPPRGGRPVSPPSYGVVVKFLSTPSARRAT